MIKKFFTSGESTTYCLLLFHIWQFRIQCIAAESVASYLLEMGISLRQITSLMQAIASYDPQQEIFLAMNFDQQIEIYRLQNLRIAPSECYKQVCDRWDEFMPDGLLPKSSHRFL
jgi:hypothetical protein